jgi:prepilin-type N-terminal cleavage/methylation domain-containing protein
MRFYMTIPTNEHGFTLVEVMIAVAVLMLGVLVLEKNIIAQVFFFYSTKLVSTAATGASSLVERLQALPFDHAWLLGVDGADVNALDNAVDGGGLLLADHAARLDANGLIVLDAGNSEVVIDRGGNLAALPAGGIFTVFWNVIGDPGQPDMKIIRVISRWRDDAHAGNVNDGDQANNQQMVVDYVRTRR